MAKATIEDFVRQLRRFQRTDPDRRRMARRLREVMEEQGVSASDLASACGVRKRTVRQWRGHGGMPTTPQPASRAVIEDLLGIPQEEWRH